MVLRVVSCSYLQWHAKIDRTQFTPTPREEITIDTGDQQLKLPLRKFFTAFKDGLTECRGLDGQELGEEGVAKMLSRLADLPSPDLLEALIRDLARHAGRESFTDDVSAAILDYRG